MRILLVEDDIKINASLKKGLERAGYAVDSEHNSDSAIDLIESSEPYDLFIIDWMLPGSTDGIGILEKIRKDFKLSAPVLMLTAKDSIEDRVMGLDSGADDYLIKPFSFSELLARINALLRRPAASTAVDLKIGGLVLQKEGFKVLVSDQVIDLTAKEFSILEYLMSSPSKVFSKPRLMAAVWNFDAGVLPNTLEVHIKTLRDKLRASSNPSTADYIKTKRGFGYYFEVNN